ncbi:MAG TPA: TIR domain-containing protein [Pyrinomonadaceae bacterium]|nr:TIR domain-containing protein [Pyrinomonadaceae bacterium]
MTHDKVHYHVFLSYGRRDIEQAEKIALLLKGQGLNVFFDKWVLPAGLPWQPELERALAECDAVIVCVGPHEMNTWQRREKDVALRRQAKDPRFRVIPVFLPGATPRVDFLTLNNWIDLRAGFDRDAQLRLAKASRGELPDPDFENQAAAALSLIQPYRGLKIFKEEDAPLFFGREDFTDRLATMVERHSFVAVLGPSGSGKSSVVQAGLVPLLRRGLHDEVWEVATIVPNDSPFQNLSSAIVDFLEPDKTEVERWEETARLTDLFTANKARLRYVVNNALKKHPGTDRLMLIVDQCEELFTLTSEPIRQKFMDELLDATTSAPLSVVLVVRNDFYNQLVKPSPIATRLHDAKLDITDLTRDQLRQVIERPAEAVGSRFEPGLVDRLLDHIASEPGKLPLLEFVLMELWKRREDRTLTNKAYNDMGELDGALAKHAEAAFESFSDSEQLIARRVFMQLVRLGDADEEPTRRRISFAELSPEALPVVRKLADENLLVTGRNDATGEEIVDLVHEALMKGWDTLGRWISEDRRFLTWRDQMQTYVKVAGAQNYEPSTLLRGQLLQEAQRWARERPSDLSRGEQRLIQESIRTRFPLKTAFAWAIITILIIGFGIWFRAVATANSRLAEIRKSNASVREMQRLVGVTSLDMDQTATVMILGPRPSGHMLSEDRIQEIKPGGANIVEAPLMEEFVFSLVECVNYVAPKTKFVFAFVRRDSNLASDLTYVWTALKNSQQMPGVVLAPYRFPDDNAAAAALQTTTPEGVVIVTAAYYGRSLSSDGRFMAVGSVDPEGERSDFSPSGDGRLLWAPGEQIVIRGPNTLSRSNGQHLAAAIAAGVAIRILDRSPNLKPAEVIERIRASSHPQGDTGPPIVNLNAALSSLPRQ